MKHIIKHTVATLCMIIIVGNLAAQDCEVEKAELKGTYTGDCKKGKANGKGKASGKDSYEGDFKAGLPEGEGVYKWQNGNEFTGYFVKGMKEGKGKLIYKRPNTTDSLVEGFWKKDIYVGKYEHPYRIINRSKLVTDVEVEYKSDPYNKVTFFITNTSGGAALADGPELPKLKVDEIQAMTGAYGRLFHNETHAKKTESVIEDIRFPFRMKATIGTEEVEIEFREPGTYVVNLRVND